MVLHNVNYSFRQISQHASRDGARFLGILGHFYQGSNDQFYVVASYIQTDRSFQVIIVTTVHSCSLENMFYKIFYPLKVPFYPLPY